MGDSHATSLLPLENRLHALGHAITHISMSGCPFPGSGFGHTSANCTRFQTYGRDLILAQGRPQDVVIVAGYHLAHLTAGSRGARDGLLDADGTVIRDADHKLSLFTDSLNDFAAAARLRGMRVVLIGAGPRLFDRETCLAEWFRPEGLTDHCAEPFREQLEQARSLNEELAKRLHPSLAFFDPLAVLCGANCSPESMRSLLFDDDHLSADAVLRFKPGLLFDFRPEADARAFPTPRSWEKLSRLLDASPTSGLELPIFAGTVGQGAAGEFLAFLRTWRQLPNPDAVLLDPDGSAVPTEPSTLYALSGALAARATPQNIDRLARYVGRMPAEFGVVTMRDASRRDPDVISTTAFIGWMADNHALMS